MLSRPKPTKGKQYIIVESDGEGLVGNCVGWSETSTGRVYVDLALHGEPMPLRKRYSDVRSEEELEEALVNRQDQ